MVHRNRTPLPLRSRQHGLGALGWLVVLAIASFALTCFFRVGPIYLDYWGTKKALDGVLLDDSLGRTSKGELLQKISKTFEVNGVTAIDTKDLSFQQTKEGLVIDASYEKRVSLIANVDVVVKFENLKYTISAMQ